MKNKEKICGESIRRVYLDTCAWCRPFDAPSHPRILQESDAIAEILKKVDSGEFEIIDSSVLHADTALPSPAVTSAGKKRRTAAAASSILF